MKFWVLALLTGLTGIVVQGCHHSKQSFPPDNFPDDGSGMPARRKRQSDILYTFGLPPNAGDVDKELSDFFTRCMSEKTGSFFPSWRSVIEFTLRDTRWYSASDEQYCSENSDRDPNTVSCWKGRLDRLLQLNSRLLGKGKECIEEFQIAEEETIIRRGKRQTTSSPFQSGLETCLGISRSKYGQCVQGNLVTQQSIREYPSLRNWDQKSVDKFISEHFSSCRITSRYTRLGNVYTETCSTGSRNPLFPNPTQNCLSSVYGEVTRTASPVFAAATTCTEKYSDDKCKRVQCPRRHQHCDKNTGRCVCDAGYREDRDGTCILESKCAFVFCGGQHETCDPSTGQCVCRSGYDRDRSGICKIQNLCSLISCHGLNEICNQNNGRCVCRSGYVRDNREICRRRDTTNPCENQNCGVNEQCVNSQGKPLCICFPGFQRFSVGVCHTPNPCSGKDCGSHGQCRNRNGVGVCICDTGYQLIGDICTRIDPCLTFPCQQNMRCGVDPRTGLPRCHCLPGHVPTTSGRGCEMPVLNPCATIRCLQYMECKVDPSTGKPKCQCLPGHVPVRGGRGCKIPDPCDNVPCSANSRCIRGQCVCDSGYQRNEMGRCVRPVLNPCAAIRCARYMECKVDPSTGRPACQCLPRHVPVVGGRGCKIPDPCDNVPCTANSRCILGRCVCDTGYQKNEMGRCVRPVLNPCAAIRCARFMECKVDPSTGRPSCQCLPRHVPVVDGRGCKIPDPCDGVPCSANSKCILGQCVCDTGYQRNEMGRCIQKNPCEDFCGEHERCFVLGGRPQCHCNEGFTLDEFGECRDSDPCATVSCEVNMECRGGTCFCLPGFVKWQNRPGCRQRVVDPCAGVNCGINMRCRNGKCVCLQDFVQDPDGMGCIKSLGSWTQWLSWRQCSKTCGTGTQMRIRQCDGQSCNGEPVQSRPCTLRPCIIRADPCFMPIPVNCGSGGRCVRGQCVCNRNAHKLDNGTCVSCPPGKVFNKCPPACYQRCGGNPPPVDLSFCITACRQNVYCVCPEGQIEMSSTDSTCAKREDCPDFWGPWGNWVKCTAPCGGGVQLRSRSCRGSDCSGAPTETRPCNASPCSGSGTCELPKVYKRCPSRCPKSCGNRALEITCRPGCRENTNCICPEGMVERSRSDTSCVNTNECPGLCFPNPCKHEGKCVAFGASYRCLCETGYSGKNCEAGCGKFCPPNGRCVRGSCVCNRGHASDGKGGCIRRSRVLQ